MNRAKDRFGTDGLRPGLVRNAAMRGSCGVRLLLMVGILSALPGCGVIWAQQTQPTGSGHMSNQPNRSVSSDVNQGLSGTAEPGTPPYEQKRLRLLNAAQHKSMVSDTDRLLKLVNELNAEINNSVPTALTPEQLRMVVEIEKLAHSVKDKMRTSVQGTPTLMESAPPVPGPFH